MNFLVAPPTDNRHVVEALATKTLIGKMMNVKVAGCCRAVFALVFAYLLVLRPKCEFSQLTPMRRFKITLVLVHLEAEIM